jgi:DNA-binding transcriptional ArsR family regulator
LKPASSAAVLIALLVHVCASVASAHQPSVLFVVSDRGDVMFLHSLGLAADIAVCSLPAGHRSYDVIFVLDYNTGGMACSKWPHGGARSLLRAARNGSVVIIGLNTLKTIALQEPSMLRSMGLVWALAGQGHRTIQPIAGLVALGAPESLAYDAARYKRLLVLPHSDWRVLSWFDDGFPAIVEQRVGRGRIVFIFFNPVWPGVRGQREYILLTRALYSYYSLAHGAPVLQAAAAAAVATAAATSAAVQRSDEAARRAVKPLTAVSLLAHRVRKEKLHEHPVRQKILRLLEEKPYITIQDLAHLGIKRPTAIWHLELMVSLGVLSMKKVAGKTIYYKSGRDREALLAFLMESRHRQMIIERLAQRAYTLSKLAEVLSINKSTAKHHVDLLLSLGVVEDRGYGYTLSSWARDVLERAKKEGAMR